jgi:hypothetical protein
LADSLLLLLLSLRVLDCEKYGPHVVDSEGNAHCSYIGYERAKHLPTLFGKGARWPAPSHLYALTPAREGHWNYRQWETLDPLSTHLGVETSIVEHYDFVDEYFTMLQAGDLCGRVTVIAWKHEYIPDLANSLGCGDENGCPSTYDENDYDTVWQLKYLYHAATETHEDEAGLVVDNSTAPTDGGPRRYLKALPVAHSQSQKGWNLYATVSAQNFDPLAFSHQAGDYPDNGTKHGGRWRDEI